MATSQQDIERACVQDLNRQFIKELDNTEKQLAKTKAMASKLKALQPNVSSDGPHTLETARLAYNAALAGGENEKAKELIRVGDAIAYQMAEEELGSMEVSIRGFREQRESCIVAEERLSKWLAVIAHLQKRQEQYIATGDFSTEAFEAERAHGAKVARLMKVDERAVDKAVRFAFTNEYSASSVPR